MPIAQWPTLVVVALIYAGFGLLTYFWQSVPLPILFIFGGILVAWYSSLEHEVIHGHPTRWAWINRLLVLPPLALWMPFSIYAQTHRAHHVDEVITDPFDDPETYYLAQGTWDQLPGALQRFFLIQNTLLGRLALGPFVSLILFGKHELALLWRRQPGRVQAWTLHLVFAAGLLAYVTWVCGMPIWIYLVCFVFPGTSLILLRSFLEHAYADDPKHRTAIVEAHWFFSLLYLNNNLHAVHHANPSMPWYDLPREYVVHGQTYLSENGAYLVKGYGQIMRSHGLRAKEPVRHPKR